VSATSTDSVNGSQLYATNQAVEANAASITNLQGDRANGVMYDTPTKDSVTLGGTDSTPPVHVRNVAAGDLGETSTDAVNGSQLYQTNQNVTKLENRVTNVEGDMTKLGDTVNNVLAGGTKYFHANSTGPDSQALGTDSVAIGTGAVAHNVNDVALGAGSITSAAAGTAETTIGGADLSFAGTNPLGTVSVGGPGFERTITNVAAGRLSATSTDAVNGSQLYATNRALKSLSSGLTDATSGAVKYDANSNGTINYSSVTLNGVLGGTVIHKVGAAVAGTDAVNLDQLNAALLGVTPNFSVSVNSSYTSNTNATANPFFTANGNPNTEGAQASGDHSSAIGAGATASATRSVALGAGSMADRENAVSVGSAGNERQITNVAPGTQGTDAVNVNQVNAAGVQANQYTD
jgi:autotransporter adhesin